MYQVRIAIETDLAIAAKRIFWTRSIEVRPAVNKEFWNQTRCSKIQKKVEIDSEFKLRYRIEICPKSPFRRKSRVSEGHKISAKF